MIDDDDQIDDEDDEDGDDDGDSGAFSLSGRLPCSAPGARLPLFR